MLKELKNQISKILIEELEDTKTLEEVEDLYYDDSLKIRGVIRASFVVYIIRKRAKMPAYTESLSTNLLSLAPLNP